MSPSEPERPQLSRQDTQQLLSYYHSPDADQSFSPTVRKSAAKHNRSTGSTSSSDYSTDSSLSEYSFKADSPPAAVFERKRSEGASDRRRLAVVQMDSVSDTDSTKATAPSSIGSLRSRRGMNGTLDGLALVAPPDVLAKSYKSHSPPVTAPVSALPSHYEPIPEHRSQGHNRSASEAIGKKPSRDVAIIGTARTPPLTTQPSPATHTTNDTALRPPLFISPQAHSPSSMAPSPSGVSPIITPLIGQGKEIGDPVASPVVMTLGPNQIADALRPSPTPSPDETERKARRISPEPASYLNYQPGLHATAGPLPPPPRAVFPLDRDSPPPPRPPRLHSASPARKQELAAVKQALQLPPSVSAVIASKSKSVVEKLDAINSSDPKLDSVKNDESSHTSSHRREGAFSPTVAEPPTPTSSKLAADPTKSVVMSKEPVPKSSSGDDIQSIVVLPPTSPAEDRPSIGKERELTASPDGRTSGELSVSSHSSRSNFAPSPPPKSPRSKTFRNSLTKGLRRMSLPRSPSYKSLTASSNSGHASASPPEPPLPAQPSRPPVPARHKIRTLYPAAMYCHEVQSQRSAQERCFIYAQKINELYICDCGLSDWVVEATFRRPNGSQSNVRVNMIPAVPSVQQFNPQPRQTSRGSMMSEATFPSRPDASVATDLSVRATEGMPNGAPALPYPALAQTGRSQSSKSSSHGHGSLTIPAMRISNPSPSKTGSFFSSLGRKASLSRKPQQLVPPTMPTTTARLTKPPPRPANNQSIPGGPRAPGNRALRSQSIMISSPFASNQYNFDKHASIARRPSLHTPPEQGVLDIQADPAFIRQVNHLADILPHADRDVLSGYLRRSGQDILAIGQYLEDEKNGTLRRD